MCVYIDNIMGSISKELKSNTSFSYYMMRFPEISKIDSLRSKLIEFCDFKYAFVDIDNDLKPDTMVQIAPKKEIRRPPPGWYFSAILLSSTKSAFLVPFSFFESITEVGGRKYLMFRIKGAETGFRLIELFTFDEEKREIVWVFGEAYWTT